MRIYWFWSADTTYFTTSKSLKKAQEVGRQNKTSFMECLEHLGEQTELEESYFIPTEVHKITLQEAVYHLRTDVDTVILDSKLSERLEYHEKSLD